MLPSLLFYKNPILHASLSLFLAFLLIFFKIPILFLCTLHSYIHPDNLAHTNGVRAAIRRPGSAASGSGVDGELRKRGKSKDKVDFDDNNAQIFRIKLDASHLQSRLYIDQFSAAFTVSFIALSSLLLHGFLDVSKNSGFLANGVFVPVLLSILGLGAWLMLLSKVTFERSASRRSEKQLSVVFGVLGVLLGILIFPEGASLVLDFDFGSIDAFWRLFVAALMGCLACFLFIPAARIARSFWVGTDQLRCNLSMITCGWFIRMILYANHILVIFVVLLWVKPLAEIFVNKNYFNNNSKGVSSMSKFGEAEKLVGNVGFLPSDFSNFRSWCLFVSSLLQIVALRSNLQMYLNEALLSWYQRLHASKVPDLDYSRAKVFLHNHYLCLVALQFLAPPVLVLLFLGLSQLNGRSFENFSLLCNLLPCSALVKEVALFMAWWVAFLYAVFSSVILMLHRHCILYVS